MICTQQMMLNLTFGEIMNVMDILEFVRKEILVISKEVVGVFILHRLWYQCRMILVEFSIVDLERVCYIAVAHCSLTKNDLQHASEMIHRVRNMIVEGKGW